MKQLSYMKYQIYTLTLVALSLCGQSVYAQAKTEERNKGVTREQYEALQRRQKKSEQELRDLRQKLTREQRQQEALRSDLSALDKALDSLRMAHEGQAREQAERAGQLRKRIGETKDSLETRSMWAIALGGAFILGLLGVLWYLRRRIAGGTDAIDKVRQAQDELSKVQARMQEEACSLDNKLLELVEKQMQATPLAPTAVESASGQEDHSLAIKVADEIVRIELNMSRMDSSIKGYKQLAKAVQRIKDNFFANGYEIIDMLGKPYHEGMKVIANFVVDDTLEAGTQIISSITKPQINYQGRMIQAAQITVSQNI